MNKNYGMELAAYTIWANNLTMEWLDQITDEQWTQVIPSSFNSIGRTAIHMVSAQKIWIDYWNRVPNPVFLSAVFNGTKSDLIAAWKNVSADLGHFIAAYPEANYLQPVLFKWPRGGEGRMAFWQSFTHMTNHSTYHRGQLVTLLRQAGFTALTSTDLATYYRIAQPQAV